MGWGEKAITSLKHAWNAFISIDQTQQYAAPGPSYSRRPDRSRLNFSNEKSIIASIYTRLGIDVSAVDIRHVRLDDNDRYTDDIKSNLNDCLKISPNIDQGPRAFRQDIAMTLFDKGVVAIVPVDTTFDPLQTGGYDIQSLRVGEIIQWKPQHVQVRLYDERTGVKKDVWLAKSFVAIVENPMYSVMNEPSSTLQRLIRKLNLLDLIDEQSGSGKLDIIVQLPYTIRSETRKKQAEERRQAIEVQLKDAQYGVAYVDATEKITQLNRPVTNNLLDQIQMLTERLYAELGMTTDVISGTANELTMLNYHNRSIIPVLDAITEAMRRTFLTKTGRSQGQSVKYLWDPFKLVPLSALPDMADRFVRNKILSSNEFRDIIGRKPDSDPNSDKLINHNLPLDQQQSTPQPAPQPAQQLDQPPQGGGQNGSA
jgi:Phage portal protein